MKLNLLILLLICFLVISEYSSKKIKKIKRNNNKYDKGLIDIKDMIFLENKLQSYKSLNRVKNRNKSNIRNRMVKDNKLQNYYYKKYEILDDLKFENNNDNLDKKNNEEYSNINENYDRDNYNNLNNRRNINNNKDSDNNYNNNNNVKKTSNTGHQDSSTELIKVLISKIDNLEAKFNDDRVNIKYTKGSTDDTSTINKNLSSNPISLNKTLLDKFSVIVGVVNKLIKECGDNLDNCYFTKKNDILLQSKSQKAIINAIYRLSNIKNNSQSNESSGIRNSLVNLNN